MLTTNRARLQERRGIALILILGMLGLLAFIGVTFATISGQARISGRNFAQAVMRPQPSDLMEFALSQLIGDTDDVRSAIRGHSMARDMYGNDAQDNGYIDQNSSVAGLLHFTLTGRVTITPSLVGTIMCYTNIPAATDIYQPLYGYDFTRWLVRFDAQMSAPPTNPETRWMGQTFEIVKDDPTGRMNGGNGRFRVFFLAPAPAPMNYRTGYHSPDVTKNPAGVSAREVNQSILIGEVPASPHVPIGVGFTLDGRFLRAFNGPGMGPLAQYANMRYNSGMLQGNPTLIGPGDTNVVGMDEDYDACDLENWFLAIQSADGKAVVPSFHRPGILRHDLTVNPVVNDWIDKTAAAKSRILRPRMADGHDPVSFPNLTPQSDGTIKYDVDNDADGTTDSVWVDLGYPPVRDSRGFLYKPMFAFMVIGLNGRIPLNTAGNLNLRNGGGTTPRYMHASHLGYSPNEVDPTFGLQNAGGFQLDNAASDTMGTLSPISVNVTQLRNILAGTRPDPYGQYADNNLLQGVLPPYYLPNNVPDGADGAGTGIGALPPRTVAGRWGEPSYIPSYFDITAATPIMVFPNLVRAGLSVTGGGLAANQTADGRDDNNTARDFWPTATSGEFAGNAPNLALPINPSVWPADYYDAAGDTAVFAERARRFVTPIDISGDGQVVNNTVGGANSLGADNWGRVGYRNYFRPPGVPSATVAGVSVPTTTARPTATVTKLGLPSFYDVTNNPLHGFESHRNPSSARITSWKQALNYGATPTSLDPGGNDGAGNPNGPVPTSGGLPLATNGTTHTPTFNASTNSLIPGTPGLNEPTETELYYSSTSDQIFGVQDLEWLYRAHDLDGTSLYSRLSELAPLSFRDASDALRRRRMYSIDVWDTNSFSWTNDNPGGYNAAGIYSTNGNFSDNSRFQSPFKNNAATNLPQINQSLINTTTGTIATADAGMDSLFLQNVPYVTQPTVGAIQASTPSLAHRDRKINLNFPLPVSNLSTEPTRLKWIAESYQFLKTVLPPLSIDQPEELALLSQYLVNIIDFRDPDATMTQFVNPDVWVHPGTATQAPCLVLTPNKAGADFPLTQYGMEYSPIAINEVLAYAYLTKATAPAPVGRFFIELVNTLTDAQTVFPTPVPSTRNASWLDLGGFNPTAASYGGGAWDLIFTDDDAANRPDPFTGQIPPAATGYYGPTPLNRNSFTGGTSVVIPSLPAAGPTAANYYCIGNKAAGPETGPPTVANEIQTSYDFMTQPTGQTAPTITVPQGVLPNITATSTTLRRMALPRSADPTGTLATPVYKWVCLRRPANPFAVVSATNPMIVVDSMRFSLIEATGKLDGDTKDAAMQTVPTVSTGYKAYSTVRFQPYRGGHLVPTLAADPAKPYPTYKPLDVTRYGYTEQIAASQTLSATAGTYTGTYPATQPIYHSLGAVETAASTTDIWERLVFNDRDFTSPAELALVPGCPPGLFTKQFVEFAPSALNTVTTPRFGGTRNINPPVLTNAFPMNLGVALSTSTNPATYPYLVDQLFYSSASPQYNGLPVTDMTWDKVVGPSSGGWYKMFEIFEVPSPVIGAIGTVAQGVNYDWFRQDVRPGQVNLNLIMDEEVFLGLVGNAGARTDTPTPPQQVVTVPTTLNSQIANLSPHPRIVTQVNAAGVPTDSYPISNTGFNLGAPVSPIKAAFCDFLSIRHGSIAYPSTVDPAITLNYMYFGATQAAEAPFRSLTYPDINSTIMRPAFPTLNRLQTDHGITAKDAGVKNQGILNRAAPPYLPPAMPPRRLFQIPDYMGSGAAGYTNISNAAFILSDTNQIGYTPPSIASLQDPSVGMVLHTATGATADVSKLLINTTQRHPYYRSEWMQKMMNLSTVRTHQYAVWVTVGFFEVTAVGDPSMALINPTAAFDVIGREVGMINGKNARHRAFFIVDRLKLAGFDSNSPGKYNEAVLYRKIIQ